MRFAALFRAALAAAFLLATASQAAAQNQRPIRRAEAAAVRAADVYEVIQRLRPEWLWAGGNPDDPATATRMRVYVGGRNIGSVHAMRGMTTTNLHSITLGGPARARALDARAIDVDAVLLVQYEDLAVSNAPPKRFQITLGIGQRALLEDRAEASQRDEGWLGYHPTVGWAYPTKAPPPLAVGASMRLRGNMGVGANVIRTSNSVRGVLPIGDLGRYVTNDYTTFDISATAFAGTRFVRVGAGPAVRLLDYTHAAGACGCNEPREGSATALGAAGDLTFIVPPSGPLNMQLSLGGRWFAPHEIPAYYDDQPPVEMGGLTLYTTLSFGVGF